MHSLQQPCCLNVGRLVINTLHFKIRSSTNHNASFTGFFQGLWPRSRQEVLGARSVLDRTSIEEFSRRLQNINVMCFFLKKYDRRHHKNHAILLPI